MSIEAALKLPNASSKIEMTLRVLQVLQLYFKVQLKHMINIQTVNIFGSKKFFVKIKVNIKLS